MRDYEFYYTQDGSTGLFSYEDDDVYHSKFGALTEAWQKFVIPSGISKDLNRKRNIRILDLCYGVGYNTKALMSYVIFTDEKILKKKKKLKNKIKILIKNFAKKLVDKYNIEATDSNNIISKTIMLLLSVETIELDKLSHVTIDCLDINNELVKISPLLKTVITPQEIFSKIVPRIFDCFEIYWKIKKFLSKIAYKFAPKNKKKIIDKLNLKFKNDYDELDREYRIHKFVNFILADKILDISGEGFFDKSLNELLKDPDNRCFFDKAILKYIRLRYKIRYDFISQLNLLSYLHNIYNHYQLK